MILNGQNFRILSWDATASKFKVIAMATNCVVTLNNNTEESSTKDDVGLASMPQVISKAWSVSVDSLAVGNVLAFLDDIKSFKKFKLVWDETSTADNMTGQHATFGRVGDAYLNDATFTFDDRANSAKSLQFTGVSPLTALDDEPYAIQSEDVGLYTRGQFIRLFLSSDATSTPSAVIAAAKTLSLHVSVTLEDSTTKDTEGSWTSQVPTGISYDISSSALVRGNDTITSSVDAKDLAGVEGIFDTGVAVKWQIANVSGANQRTKGSIIASGKAIITQLQITAQNRQAATYQTTLNGYGALAVGA